MQIPLNELEIRGRCRVFKLLGRGHVRKRLMEMGLVKGAEIIVEKVAPLGDPVELVVKGYHLSLRKDEACNVIVEKL